MDSSTQSNAAYEGEQISLKKDENISQSKRSVIASKTSTYMMMLVLFHRQLSLDVLS